MGGDRFALAKLGRYGFKVQGWVDHFETWRRDLLKRIKAESDARVDYLIGADLVDAAAARAEGPAGMRCGCGSARGSCDRASRLSELRIQATDPMLHEIMLRYPDKRFATESEREYEHRGRSGAGAIQRVVRIFSALDSGRSRQARHFCRLREAAAVDRGDGLQRCVSAANSSHRAHVSQGAEQQS